MPAETKGFAMFPHDWHSTDYVAEWITRDAARDRELSRMKEALKSVTGRPSLLAPSPEMSMTRLVAT